MKHQALAFIALLALVSLVIIPVSAETVTGTLGGTNFSQTTFTVDEGLAGITPDRIYFNDIENTGNMYSVILAPKHILTVDEDAPTGNTAGFTAYLLTTYNGVRVDEIPVATGRVGYQQIFDSSTPPVQQTTGYFWIVFDTWNITGRSGDGYLELNYTDIYDLYNVTVPHKDVSTPVPSGGIGIGFSTSNAVGSGDYINNRYDPVTGNYIAIKPSGLGIAGNVSKIGNSRIFIENVSEYVVASDNLANEDTFNFNVVGNQIYIKMLSTSGSWYNSSLLFSSGEPTPTPTFPPGYSRTYFRCADTNTDGSVSGCNIQLKDVESNVWSNATDLDDGIWYIDTLPLHTIDAYGDATGYTNGSRIGVQEWNMMRYTIPMIPGYLPPPAEGYVWVYVHVTDFSGTTNLPGATVSLSGSGLSTVVTTTDSSGIAMLQWQNVTTAFINAAKPGYTTGMRVIETSDFGPDFVTIALHQGTYTSTITPTPSISGAPTAAPTLDPRTDTEKDTAMMNQVRDAGPILISLAILATIMGLLKLMAKK